MRLVPSRRARLHAFRSPDDRPLAFVLPGRLRPSLVARIARAAFGYRADVRRTSAQWLVIRRAFQPTAFGTGRREAA